MLTGLSLPVGGPAPKIPKQARYDKHDDQENCRPQHVVHHPGRKEKLTGPQHQHHANDNARSHKVHQPITVCSCPPRSAKSTPALEPKALPQNSNKNQGRHLHTKVFVGIPRCFSMCLFHAFQILRCQGTQKGHRKAGQPPHEALGAPGNGLLDIAQSKLKRHSVKLTPENWNCSSQEPSHLDLLVKNSTKKKSIKTSYKIQDQSKVIKNH